MTITNLRAKPRYIQMIYRNNPYFFGTPQINFIMEKTFDDMQNCNFCKTVLMIIIVLYHAGMFWTNNWFTVITPVQQAPIIGIFVNWMATFHIYAFTMISGYIYYYVRYQRGGYDNLKGFIKNKCRRLIIPYISVAALWVIPIGSLFFDFDANTIINRYVLGESPSQLWFLLMLFGVFIIAYPMSNIFRFNTKLSIHIVITMWIIGKWLATILPDLFQIFNSLQFILFFWLGFELRKRWMQGIKHNTLIYGLLGGGCADTKHFMFRSNLVYTFNQHHS